MKLANNALIIALTMLMLTFSISAQRTEKDPRNTAPTVGTGGPPGGPTGLFTIYDGQTLRRGEFTFSVAWSNYDRDPGDVDINEIPVSFQVGLNNYIELFFNTDAYRGIKVNSPRNLSSFYLPNSQLNIGGRLQNLPAIVQGTGAFRNLPVFRNTQPFIPFPFVGGASTRFGVIPTPVGGNGNQAANFPGVGSVYGSILPGVVFATTTIVVGGTTQVVPTSSSTVPSYLPDAPFINRTYGESAFSTFTVGGKIRFTNPDSPYGIGIIPFYRFYADRGTDFSGFNQLQRGASPGGNRGDFGLVVFGDARLSKHINLSANLGYIYNASVKADFPGGKFTILDRPDEVIAGIGADFPINRYFQPIIEFRSTQYVGGRTPNAFENSPLDLIGGVRFFPTRYVSFGAAYRRHLNSQDDGSFKNAIPLGFRTSDDPNGFIFQVTAGRRNKRETIKVNGFADVTDVSLSQNEIGTGCQPGYRPREGTSCNTEMMVGVTTTAVDPENDVLTYNYTVSGGRIVGQGANVQWDLSGANPGTYTITSGVDDGCGVCGKTQTKTITVKACDCEQVCVCPTISVSGPGGLTAAGGTITFTSNVSGGSSDSITYNWSVDNGTIIEGQGTPTIRVATTPEMAGQNVTATLKVEGLCAECRNSASDNAGIESRPTFVSVDEFGNVPNDEVKARVDNFYIQLNNNPSAQGIIINYGTDKEIAKREKQIRDAIKFRKYDESRVRFVRGGDRGTGINTKFYLVPQGAEEPQP